MISRWGRIFEFVFDGHHSQVIETDRVEFLVEEFLLVEFAA